MTLETPEATVGNHTKWRRVCQEQKIQSRSIASETHDDTTTQWSTATATANGNSNNVRGREEEKKVRYSTQFFF